jgi:hypothetical protein
VKAGEIDAGYFPDPKDKWTPKSTPSEFESIIVRESPPTDEQITPLSPHDSPSDHLTQKANS